MQTMPNTLNAPQLNQWVLSEAQNILKYATAEELAKIKLNKVDQALGFRSIYTELTGAITSDRANELLKLCAVVSINHSNDKLKKLKNGQTFKRGKFGWNQKLSAIEYFLLQTHFSRKIKRVPLVDFLTGKSADLATLRY
jgi:hypothetical protein